MADHYFSQTPQSERSPKTWQYRLRGTMYTFTSDVGVFSKNEVDFGSRLLIEEFTEPEKAGDFLDLGCGYGPIGIALADHYPERHIVMSDVNERALELSKENAAHNHVENVAILQSDRFAQLENRSFAAIITNPPIRAGKQVVHQMFEESAKSLKSGGELWVVIQKKQGAPSAKKKLESLFTEVDTVARDKRYYIFKAVNV
ncbi:class I SAM-dependent methyltransferase [Lentibacillus sediminis]|uniref:class I SAM-dependent methyltransferase n=1 Tax=Lentibacillus sediminis TaxID=1940529 RepID=UPI000C1C0C86|nr:class I SAM-dependent methyltransferase [Lentibacillus sediminis]